MEPTEELKQVVRSYREGNKQAFTALYVESSKYIYTRIHNVMGGNDNVQDAICDIMQDTYVEISRKIGQLDSEDRFLSWAGIIAARKCYAWLKKNKKYVLLNEEDDTLTNLADDDDIIPEGIMQDREKQRLVREIIETQLTQMQRLCIIAFYYNEQKQSDIAKELGIPENTVKTNLSRAKAKIKAGVLDLEKSQGTRLYGVAPILLLLFKEDVEACTVPPAITGAVNSAVAAAGKMGMKQLLGKMAEASVKAKVAAGAAGAAAVVAVGSVAYVAMQDKGEPWEEEFRKILMEDDEAVGFDLNDFEEDGIPELVILEEDGSLTLCSFREGEETLVSTLVAESQVQGDDAQIQNYYGYDCEYGRLINLMDVAVSVDGRVADHFTVPKYIQYLDGKKEFCEITGYGYKKSDYSVSLLYYVGEDGEIFGEEAMEYLAEAQARFNEIKYTDITEEDIQERFEEFKEEGNRRRKRNRVEEAADQTENGAGTETQESQSSQESQGPQDSQASQDAQEIPTEETEITLSEEQRSDIKMLAALISMNSYFFGGDMYGGRYPVDDVSINMKLIDEIGNMGLGDNSYMEYLPPTEMGDGTYNRYCRIDDVQSYLKNVFGIENADISAFCDGDRVVFSMVGDFALVDATIDSAVLMPDNTYKINGVFSIWITVDYPIEVTYPYELTVIRNDASPFGFQVISMEFGEEVLRDQLQQPSGDSADGQAVIAGGDPVAVDIPMPYGRYTSNRGAELEFFNETTVRVSEGGSHTDCLFTIDGEGNLVIDPDGEALEGTYNAQTDIIWIYNIKFRK